MRILYFDLFSVPLIPSSREAETILSDIIPVFYLDLPADEELAWMLGGIVSPGVKGDPVPKLPLRLTLVED